MRCRSRRSSVGAGHIESAYETRRIAWIYFAYQGLAANRQRRFIKSDRPLEFLFLSHGLTDFLYQRDREIIALARPDPAVA